VTSDPKATTLHQANAAFDDLAEAYDASFTASALGRALRALTCERLDAALGGAAHVLEIGCGTGEDAVHLARRGTRVLAIDPSPLMLRIAAAKAKRLGCGERIDFRCLPFERVGELRGHRFDGVWSNFGALNCVSNLEAGVAALAPLVTAGAPLVWVVMGRHVPWEWAWFLLRGRPDRAFRRLHAGGTVWRNLRIVYPTPAELERALAPHFAPVRRSPLGFALPPSYASRWLERRPRIEAALQRVELAAQRCSPLASLADHYVLEARRTPAVDA
jgi:SAM-dependent methyltransferase